MLLTVKKPAKIFDIAVMRNRAPCNKYDVVRGYVFALHLACMKNGCFSILKAKNINGNTSGISCRGVGNDMPVKSRPSSIGYLLGL